jgi:rhodanese-related sulfurtransferase
VWLALRGACCDPLVGATAALDEPDGSLSLLDVRLADMGHAERAEGQHRAEPGGRFSSADFECRRETAQRAHTASMELTAHQAATTIRRVSVPRISKEDLKSQLESEQAPTIVDARLKYPYEHSTVKLPGAIRFTGDGPVPNLPKDRGVVVYDSDPNELASTRVAVSLIKQGYRVTALKGGIGDWLAGNLPTETKEAPKQAPPEPGALKG